MCHAFTTVLIAALIIVAGTVIVFAVALVGFARRLDRSELTAEDRDADTIWTNTPIRRHRYPRQRTGERQ